MACYNCGFEDDKYTELVNGRQLCYFCAATSDYDKAAKLKTGILIWLPEISQADLNHIMRTVYVARVTPGPLADQARSVLEFMMGRRSDAKARIGTDDPGLLSKVIHDFIPPHQQDDLSARMEGIRVLPLDRRMVTEGQMEFNQFPQILAYWRGPDGPFSRKNASDWAEDFIKLSADMAA